MNVPLPGVTVDPQGVSTSVAITDSRGNTPTAYSDHYGVNTVALPDTITARTTFFLPGEGPWTITPTANGQVTKTTTLTLEDSQVATVTVGSVFDASQWEQFGAYASVSNANTWTAKQTFNSSGVQVQNEDGNGNTVSLMQNIGGSTHFAGAVQLFGSNGLGTAGSASAAWQFGVDTNAAIPYRDFFLSKWLPSNGVSDPDGIYISNGGATEPAGVGIGLSQPNNFGSLFRLKVMATGSGGVNPDPTQGGLQVQWATGQTGDVLALGSSNDSTTAFRVRSDGTILAHASAAADVAVTDAVTNGTTALTSDTAGFTAQSVGQYITGTNIPSGTYITTYVSATQVTMSQAASGSGSGGTLNMLGRAYQFRSTGNLPFLTIGSNGSGGSAVAIWDSVGIGPAAGTAPNSMVDIAQVSGSAASLSVRQASGGNFRVLTSASDVSLSTQNATALRLGTGGSAAGLVVEVDTSQNIIVGPAATATPAELATTATAGFFYIPTVNGTPTGTPSALPTGGAPSVIDRSGNKLWFYVGGSWKGVAVA